MRGGLNGSVQQKEMFVLIKEMADHKKKDDERRAHALQQMCQEKKRKSRGLLDVLKSSTVLVKVT